MGDEIRGVIGLDFRYKKAHAYKRDCRITGGFDGKASDIEETSVDTQRIYTDIDNALDTADTIISCYQRSSDNDKPSPIAVGTYYCEDDESMTARNYSPQRDFYGSEVVTSRPPPPRTNMFTYGEASNVTSETPTRSGAVSDFVSSVGIATIPTAGTDRLNLSDMFHNSSGTTKRGRK